MKKIIFLGIILFSFTYSVNAAEKRDCSGIKKILLLLTTITLTSCATLKDNLPERQVCTGNETNKTLSEMVCKKQ